MRKVGIDVSKWQAKIDWHRVKNYGISFAMVRLGKGVRNLEYDQTADYNITECMRLGIPVGVYVYSYSNTAAQAAELMRQAMEWIKTKQYKLDMPVAFDIEFDDCHTTCSKAVNSAKIKAAMQVVESYGYYGIVYASLNFLTTYTDLTKLQVYDKWIAAYRGTDNIGIPHGMWQYSSKGAIPGIKGNVDKDVAYKDYPSIIKRAGLNKLPKNREYKITITPMSEGDKNTIVSQCKTLGLNYTLSEN